MRLFFIILFCGLLACTRVSPGFVEPSNGTTEDQYFKAGWPQFVQGQYLEALKAWEQQLASGKIPTVPMMIHMATIYGVRGHPLMRSGDLGSARKAFRRQSDLLLSAGERASPSAFERLTMVYIQGNGVPPSKEDYRSVVEKAYLGDEEAQYRLNLYAMVNTKSQWYKIVSVKKWMDKAATREYTKGTVIRHFDSQYVHQKMEEELEKGKEALRSHQEEVALQLYRILARTGKAEAQAREPLQAVNVLIAEGQRPRVVDGPTCLKDVLDFRLLGMKPTQDGELKFKLDQSARVKNLTNYYVMFQARIHYSGNIISQGHSHSPNYPVNIHKRLLLYISPRANAAEWTFPVRKVYRWIPRAQWKIQAELEEDQSSCYLYSVPPAHWDPDHPNLL